MSPKTKTVGVVALLMAGSFVAGFKTSHKLFLIALEQTYKPRKMWNPKQDKHETWLRPRKGE